MVPVKGRREVAADAIGMRAIVAQVPALVKGKATRAEKVGTEINPA